MAENIEHSNGPQKPEWMKESSEALQNLKAQIEKSSGISQVQKEFPNLIIDHNNINFALRYLQLEEVLGLYSQGEKISTNSNKNAFIDNKSTLEGYKKILTKALKEGPESLSDPENKGYAELQNVLIGNKELLKKSNEIVHSSYIRDAREKTETQNTTKPPIKTPEVQDEKPTNSEKPAEKKESVTTKDIELTDSMAKPGKIIIPKGYDPSKPTEVVVYFQGYSSFGDTMNTLQSLMKHNTESNRVFFIPNGTKKRLGDPNAKREHDQWFTQEGSISTYLQKSIQQTKDQVNLGENYSLNIIGHSAGGRVVRDAFTRDKIQSTYNVNNVRIIDGSYGNWASATSAALRNSHTSLTNVYLKGTQTETDAKRLPATEQVGVSLASGKSHTQHHMDLRKEYFL